VALDVPELVINTAPLDRRFAMTGEAHWFKFTSSASQDILLALDAIDNQGIIELYLGCGYMPTRQVFDMQQDEQNAADVSIFLPKGSMQTCYLLAYPEALPGGAQEFHISARTLQFELTALSPNLVGNAGPVTFEVHSGQLAAGLTFEIVARGGAVYTPTWTAPVNSTLANVTFNLAGLPQGSYTLRARYHTTTVSLAGALTLVKGIASHVWVDITGRTNIGSYRTAHFYIQYGNLGNVDTLPTWLRVAVPAGLCVTEAPGYAYMSFVSCDHERLLEFLLPRIPPLASGSIELVLTAGAIGKAQLRVVSLTMAGLDPNPIFPPEDPTTSVTPELIEATGGSYLHTVQHVDTLVSHIGDLDFKMYVQPATQEIEPTLILTQTATRETWVFEATMLSGTLAPGEVPGGSPGETVAPQAAAGAINKIKVVIDGGKEAYDKVEKVKKYLEPYQLSVTQRTLTKYLLDHGFITQATMTSWTRKPREALC
jgi:hypothetical protein